MTVRKVKRIRKPVWYVTVTIAGIICFYGVIKYSDDIIHIWRLSRMKHSEQEALDNALIRREMLKREIERLNTDSSYIEEIAREEYGMIKKGEQVFTITLPKSESKVKKNTE